MIGKLGLNFDIADNKFNCIITKIRNSNMAATPH